MTHYEVLQVLHTASPEVIQMAYKALARKYHPDVFQGNKEYAEAIMKRINEAYRVLSSPDLRREYDRSLQRVKEQTYQSYQAPQPQKQAPKKKNKDSAAIITMVIIAAILIGPILLGAFDNDTNKTTNSSQISKYPEKEETKPPQAVIIPRSGDILSGSECFDGSELTITADSGSSYVVKLKTVSGVERLSFYVRAGDTVTVGVPAESLYVYFASGDTWYGTRLLFGEETYYSMDDEALDFTEYTWEYTLYPVNSGNFSETPIDPSDF